MSRDRGSRLLVSLAALALLAGLLVLWIERSFVDSRGFADRATAALDAPAIQVFLADRGDLLAVVDVLNGVGER